MPSSADSRLHRPETLKHLSGFSSVLLCLLSGMDCRCYRHVRILVKAIGES